MREQTQVSARPKLAPKPRRRSSRGCPLDGKVGASRLIAAAAGCLASKRRVAHSLTFAAPKVAAPTAFAHRIRDPSVLHSQTGDALVA